jgi:hypothetical protein
MFNKKRDVFRFVWSLGVLLILFTIGNRPTAGIAISQPDTLEFEASNPTSSIDAHKEASITMADISTSWQAFETTLYTDIYNANFPYNVHVYDLDGLGNPELVIAGVLSDYSLIPTPNPRCSWCNQWQIDAFSWDDGGLTGKLSESLDVGYDTKIRSDIGLIGGAVKLTGVGNLYPCGSGEPHAGMGTFDNTLKNEHYDWGERQSDPCHHDLSVFYTVDMADVDADGDVEIIAGGAGDSTGGTSTYRDWLLAIRTSDGVAYTEELYQHIDNGGSTEILTDLQVADVDGDTTPEIVATGYSNGTGVTRTWLHIMTWDGLDLRSEYSRTFEIGSEDYFQWLAVGNVVGDTKPEIVLAGRAKTNTTRDWYLKVLRWGGANLTEVAEKSWDLGSDGMIQAIEISDIDNDGQNEILLAGNVNETDVPGSSGGYYHVHRYADWYLKVLSLAGSSLIEEIALQWDSSRDYDSNNNGSPDSSDQGAQGRLYDMDVGDLDNDGSLEVALVGEWIWSGWHIKILDKPDLIPIGLEVTQAIQSITNTVTLVEGKRTFARFHVKTDGPELSGVTALLSATRGGVSLGEALSPGNPGMTITAIADPDRGVLNDSFYFELPLEWLTGTLQLTAEVNPAHTLIEDDYQNNLFTTSVTFEPTPPITVTIVGAVYNTSNITYTAGITDYQAIASWLRAVYPTSQVNLITQTLTISGGLPTASQMNIHLATQYTLDAGNTDQCANTRYYGLVDDGGGFMRGRSAGIPACIASGPTGDHDWDWDFDGSYGDWYTGHELGHAFGRYHAEFCGARGGIPYPYPNGQIGGPAADPDKFYGFNIETLDVYTPTLWKDFMSYCDNQWVSDFTYEGLQDRFVTEAARTNANSEITYPSADGYLLVLGEMNLTLNSHELGTLYRLPKLTPSERPDDSEFEIRLLDASDGIIARYPFTPKEDTEPQPGEDLWSMIYEIVPYVAGTARVVVVHGEVEFASQGVSPNPPVVTVIYPNGGESLGEKVTFKWSGTDSDAGDTLSYALQYSSDDGQTWTTFATGIRNTKYTLRTGELAGSDNGRFRVLASDGVNTAWGESASSFRVPFKSPSTRIIHPGSGKQYVDEQTVVLVGEAYDREDGFLQGESFVWSSSQDGLLGSGTRVAVTGLSPGEHTVTLTATDSDTMSGTATITISITSRPMVYLPMVLR